jgi:hypothetical protein
VDARGGAAEIKRLQKENARTTDSQRDPKGRERDGINACIHNDRKIVGLPGHDPLQAAACGGAVDLCFGPEPPTSLESNWILTAERDLWLTVRFHGPQPPLFDTTWIADDVELLT